jgi:hypothetical protein
MSQPYLDSAGNVNTAVANDIQNFVLAARQAAAVPQAAAATQAAVVAAGAQLSTDAVTGMPNTVVCDV